MTFPTLLSLVIELIECVIHNYLYTRVIYPENLFEQRRAVGISVWQSRHPEINSYIKRVLQNTSILLEKRMVDRIIIVVQDSVGTVKEHFTIKCDILGLYVATTRLSSEPNVDMSTLEEEFRSTLLRIRLIDGQLPKLPTDCSWSLMVVTKKDLNASMEESLESALTNGEWHIDNNQLTEQQTLAQRSSESGAENPTTASTGVPITNTHKATTEENSRVTEQSPSLVPVKSFRNNLVNLSVYAHVFKASS